MCRRGRATPPGSQAATERALAMLDAINAMGRTEGELVARVTTTADAIEQARRDGVLAVIPAVENGHAMGEDLGLLARVPAPRARAISR